MTCDEITDAVTISYDNVLDTVSIYLSDKRQSCKIDNYYILLNLLLVTTLLLNITICYY